jgi:hypothetical protein
VSVSPHQPRLIAVAVLALIAMALYWLVTLLDDANKVVP